MPRTTGSARGIFTFYNGGSENPKKATAKTYDFTALTSDDLTALGVTATEGNNKATAVVSATSATLSIGATVKQSDSGKFKLEFTNKTNSTLEGVGDLKTINYNTSSTGNSGIPADISTLATVADLANIISIPVDGAGTVTVSGKFGNSTNNAVTDTDKLVAVLYDASGKKLASQEQATKTSADLSTLSGEVSGATTVYVVFYRSSGYGGLKISKIEVAPAN